MHEPVGIYYGIVICIHELVMVRLRHLDRSTYRSKDLKIRRILLEIGRTVTCVGMDDHQYLVLVGSHYVLLETFEQDAVVPVVSFRESCLEVLDLAVAVDMDRRFAPVAGPPGNVHSCPEKIVRKDFIKLVDGGMVKYCLDTCGGIGCGSIGDQSGHTVCRSIRIGLSFITIEGEMVPSRGLPYHKHAHILSVPDDLRIRKEDFLGITLLLCTEVSECVYSI